MKTASKNKYYNRSHIFEQRADNKLIRPSAEYIGSPPQVFLPIENR